MSMVLPGVIGFRLLGELPEGIMATDLVLTVTQMLRKHGVVGKFVEFYGIRFSYLIQYCGIFPFWVCLHSSFIIILVPLHCIGEGMSTLSLADRATIANMSPEYGAIMGFFPVDHITLQYLKLIGRSDETVCYFQTTM